MEIVLIAVLVLLFTLVIGVPVPFSFGAATIFLAYFGGYSPDTLIPVGYSKMNTVVLLAIHTPASASPATQGGDPPAAGAVEVTGCVIHRGS
jgi:hypothetical protein